MKFFRDARNLTSSAFVAAVLAALRSILILRVVSPTVIGVWKSAMALYVIGDFGRLGVDRGMAAKVPLLSGQGKEEEAQQTAHDAGNFTLVAGLLMGCGLLVWSLLAETPDYRVALAYMAVVVFISQPYMFLRGLAAANRQFAIRTRENLLTAVIQFVGFLVLSYLYGLHGLGIATVLGVVLPGIYLLWSLKFSFGFHLPIQRLKELIRYGLPLSVAEGAYGLVRRLDIIMLVLLMGPTWVGYYGVSLQIIEFSLVLAASLSQVVAPTLMHEYGKGGTLSEAAVYYETPVRLFSYVLPPVLGVGVLFLPIFIREVLPSYIPGTESAQVTLWGIFFVVVYACMAPFLVAAAKIPSMLKMYAVLIPLGALSHGLVIKLGFGLVGVAWTTVGQMFVINLFQIYLARISERYRLLETLRYVISLHIPLVVSIVVTMFLEPLSFGEGIPEWLTLCYKSVLLFALYTPVLFFYENRFSLLRAVRQTI